MNRGLLARAIEPSSSSEGARARARINYLSAFVKGLRPLELKARRDGNLLRVPENERKRGRP